MGMVLLGRGNVVDDCEPLGVARFATSFKVVVRV
jgi:hypothetical protein